MSVNILFKSKSVYTEYKCHDMSSIKIFGFWIYLMSDCILFATLFATYSVLSNNVMNGPISKDVFNVPFVFIETLFLLLSNITYCIAMLFMYKNKVSLVNIWLGLTFLLGSIFVSMEWYEFQHLIDKGYSPDCNAFLSSFFTLVGTHGLHVFSGLIWIVVMIAQNFYHGLTLVNKNRMQCLSLFWHFLDIIWICVFTVVYLIGSLL